MFRLLQSRRERRQKFKSDPENAGKLSGRTASRLAPPCFTSSPATHSFETSLGNTLSETTCISTDDASPNHQSRRAAARVFPDDGKRRLRERTTSPPNKAEMVQEGTQEEEELGAYQLDSFSPVARTRSARGARFCPGASLVADQVHALQTC